MIKNKIYHSRAVVQQILIISALVLSSIWSSILAQTRSGIDISFKDNVLKVQNSHFERTYKYDSSGPIHYFYPASWIDKTRDMNLLSQDNRKWFEFCINDQLIKSEQGGWQYQKYEKRNLENGGVELIIYLSGQSSVSDVHGAISLKYYLQIFPNSTVIREKFEIIPKTDEKIYLSNYENKIKLIFPEYSFNISGTNELSIQETRLAEWEGEVLTNIDRNIRPDDRLNLGAGKSGRNLAQNHMYHPGRYHRLLNSENPDEYMKGPISLAIDKSLNTGYIAAYEHGSPDNDEMQNYLQIVHQINGNNLKISIQAQKGAYFANESIQKQNPYSTVWIDLGFFEGSTFSEGEHTFWKFLYHYQSEHLGPRKPTIYYNTWGLQRDDQKEKKQKPQLILTEERVLQEIDYAQELGVTVFVIDDGWQNYFGDWQPVNDRFPNGFDKIKTRLDSLGMRMGLWLAAEGIDRNSHLYTKHPEWLVRDEDGNEILGRWNKPIGCFSSKYKKYFTELCKQYIDKGFTYFKWDGLDKYLCYEKNHYHGDHSTGPNERAERSGYKFILEITEVARVLTNYNPDVVIVYDMTEKLRNVGLAFLSEARFFWINNGATWYDDLSFYRAKSIRSVANIYHQIIPTILQTSANYPHQSEMYGAQRYNVNTTLLGGGGFWGDLSEMTTEERRRIGEIVDIYLKVAGTVVSTRPLVSGVIGSSPEIYEFINTEKAEGQVIAFSGSAQKKTYITQPVNINNFLCVLRNAYRLEKDGTIHLPFQFPQADATCEAFVLQNDEFPVQILSSTAWLKSAQISGNSEFTYTSGAKGIQHITWSKKLGHPEITSSDKENTIIKIESMDKTYHIEVAQLSPEIEIRIKPR